MEALEALEALEAVLEEEAEVEEEVTETEAEVVYVMLSRKAIATEEAHADSHMRVVVVEAVAVEDEEEVVEVGVEILEVEVVGVVLVMLSRRVIVTGEARAGFPTVEKVNGLGEKRFSQIIIGVTDGKNIHVAMIICSGLYERNVWSRSRYVSSYLFCLAADVLPHYAL